MSVKSDNDIDVIIKKAEELEKQADPSSSTAGELIQQIQSELNAAAFNLDVARLEQEDAIGAALEGDFEGAVFFARAAGAYLRFAKVHEARASRLLVQLITQMRAEGFTNEQIFGVVEALIAEFVGL